MKALLMCGVLSMIGLFACVESTEMEPDPATGTAVERSDQDSEVPGEAPALLGDGICCIDYVCPTNGFETTGCKAGSTGPLPALLACKAACGGMYCHAGEWFCP